MLDNFRHISHFFRIARVLGKHNALFFLDKIKLPPFVKMITSALSSFPLPLREGLGEGFNNKDSSLDDSLTLTLSQRERGRESLSRGKRLTVALQELGPTFIKLGQALSVRPDMVGEEIAGELAKLQDKLPAFSTEEAILTIEEGLGAKIDELFEDFSPEPVAAASISQVHFATSKSGEKLAVKVLRPKIEEAFARDIDFLYWLAGIATKRAPKIKRLRLKDVVDNFADTVKIEMDLRFEAAAAAELKENLAGDEGILIPAIDWQKTSGRVLTMERVAGISINDKEALIAAGHDTNVILQKAVYMFFIQVLRDGFFHADMHPGNLFIGENSEIIVVDFGIMGRIDQETRIFLAEMLLAFLKRDYKKVAEVHFAAGYTPPHHSLELFAQACRSVAEPILGKGQSDISIALLLKQLFKITADFDMETQPQLILLQKTMVQVEGLGRMLEKSANFWEISEPLIADWMKKNMGLEAKLCETFSEVKGLYSRGGILLNIIDKLPEIITSDGIKLHPSTIENFSNQNKNSISIWKIVAISAITAFVVANLVRL